MYHRTSRSHEYLRREYMRNNLITVPINVMITVPINVAMIFTDFS
jgi:hypothetical protein